MHKILWIEDSGSVLYYGKEILESKGMEVHAAHTNHRAMAYLDQEKHYDLIISDLNRDPTGCEDLEKTHAGLLTGVVFYEEFIKKKLPSTPVVFFTAFTDALTQLKIQQFPNCRLISKSFNATTDLLALINSILNEDRQLLYDDTGASGVSYSVLRVDFTHVNQELLTYLSRHPDSIYSLAPRKFEELVANILSDLGYETTLTPQTWDGGFDIRAVRKDGVGDFLYVVECKRYAPDRPVGVGHVRSLYGTRNDTGASSAILVTSSYFTKPAKAYQRHHPYELSLRDRENLKRWLEAYRQR